MELWSLAHLGPSTAVCLVLVACSNQHLLVRPQYQQRSSLLQQQSCRVPLPRAGDD